MVHESLVAAKLVVLGIGAAVAGVAFLSWRRTHDPLMLWVSVAFLVLALGSSAEGFFFELLGWDLRTVHTLESVGVLAGLLILLFVLRPARRPKGGTGGPPDASDGGKPQPIEEAVP